MSCHGPSLSSQTLPSGPNIDTIITFGARTRAARALACALAVVSDAAAGVLACTVAAGRQPAAASTTPASERRKTVEQRRRVFMANRSLIFAAPWHGTRACRCTQQASAASHIRVARIGDM